MTRVHALPLCVLLAATALACEKRSSEPATAQAPRAQAMPDWKTAISHQVRFDAASGEVVVDVDVKPGFHAYAVGETTGKPLQLQIADDSEFGLDGEVRYPKGHEKDLPTGRSVIVQGQAQVLATVKAKSEAAKTVKGTFHYQVCTDEACDRPRSQAFALSAP